MAIGKRRGSVRWREDIQKYVIDFYDNLGKRHVETIGKNWHEADRALNDRMTRIDNGTFNPARGQTLFKDFAEKWYNNKVGIKPATLLSYRVILDTHLIPYFGNAKISNIARVNIQDFVSFKVKEEKTHERNLSPKTLSNILVVLHQILEEAEIAGEIIMNPYIKIERPTVEAEEQDYLTLSEIPLYLNASK